MRHVTRFAPSPTGHLHLGHAFAAGFAWLEARRSGGRFLVRMEDIDSTRVRSDYEHDLLEDLAWLGLSWETPVLRQSEHMADYQAALDQLAARSLLYPCFCTRREIQAELARAASAPQGPDGPLYPGTCRELTADQRAERLAAGQPFSLRLDMAAALRACGEELLWTDLDRGTHTARPAIFGDVILGRKEVPTSYHLAVVMDDARQGVSLVTRGEDLLAATHLHRLLQELLGLPVPSWRHHRLVVDAAGKRLAKRDLATSLRTLRSEGCDVGRIWELVMLPL